MNKNNLKISINNWSIEWQRHALEQMMERCITRKAVKEVLKTGEIIEDYPDDKPYPSKLLFRSIQGKPLHVVAAFNTNNKVCYIITAYIPDLEHFESDYRTRRKL